MARKVMPGVSSFGGLLDRSKIVGFAGLIGQNRVVSRVRRMVGDLRDSASKAPRQRLHEIGAAVNRLARQILPADNAAPAPVINASGILAPDGSEIPLSEAALAAMAAIGGEYSAPSIDNVRGARPLESLLEELSGAEAALVLHRPGAAVVATLAALAAGREVIVARGQVGAIDESLTLPEAAACAAAVLREVGTVNVASAADVRAALGERTAALLDAPARDYAIVGNQQRLSCDELISLAQAASRPVVQLLSAAALGEGAALFGMTQVSQSLASGADLVIFAGDRFLGGPQSGIIVGRRELIQRIADHPLARSAWPGHSMLAALAATLEAHRDPRQAALSLPLARLLQASSENLKHRAERLAAQLAQCVLVEKAEVMRGFGYLGSAGLPDEALPSWRVVITPLRGGAAGLSRALQTSSPAILPQIEAGSAEPGVVSLNLRSVFPAQDEAIVAAFARFGWKTSHANGADSGLPTTV